MMLLVSGSTRSVGRLAPSFPQRLGHLLTPANRNSMDALLSTGLMWAVDNAAYSGFDAKKFKRLLARVKRHPRCLFVVAPDAVAKAQETLDRFMEWWPTMATCGQPIAFVGQDGQEDLELPATSLWQALFIGGTTEWKESSAAAGLAEEAKSQGKWVHMGRVNSRRRMELASEMGCDSIDGSSASMFGDTYIAKYLKWLEEIDSQPLLV